jgi:SpoVK/Ycf46/Vps4 family AAA+-type ATPase
MLAAGMYSSDSEGRPKRWTKKRVRRLREIFEEKKRRNPRLTQAAIAKEIIDESPDPDIKPSTLLRRLPRKPRRPRP